MSEQKGLCSHGKVIARRTGVVPGDFSRVECGQKAAHVCAICEEGGDLLFCDGPCMHHFHKNKMSKGATHYACLGIIGTKMFHEEWKCPDCELGQAKCFACPLVGSFEGLGRGAPVLRQCPDPLCIRFFCFTCLPPEKEACALHTCVSCRKLESSIAGMVHCLRCPKAWHFNCLTKEQKKGYCAHRKIYQHKWNGQLRHMFYCHEHLLDPHMGTPLRKHLTDVVF